MGLGDEVLSGQANYTCGIWAADRPVTPYLMRKRQPQQLFKTKCHRGISFAGSWPVQDCFSHSLSHLVQECALGRPAVGGRTSQGGGDRRGGPCQVSVLSPLSTDRLADPTTWPFYSPNPPPRNRLGGAVSVLLGTGEKPGHVTIKGRRQKTLGRRGRGELLHPDSTGLLSGPPRQGQKPGRRVSARVQRPGQGRHPSAPLTVQREVPSPAQFAAATALGHLET